MTIHDAIEMVDRLKPNQYGPERKIAWLSMLDGLIWRELYLTREHKATRPVIHHNPFAPSGAVIEVEGGITIDQMCGAPSDEESERRRKQISYWENGYAPDADPDTELLIPHPYAEDIYNFYLQSRIDLENGEIQKYNNSNAMYTAAYSRFASAFNRERPQQTAVPYMRF